MWASDLPAKIPRPQRLHSQPALERYHTKVVSNPHLNKSLTHASINKLLRDELRDATFRDIPDLIEHLLPTSALPNGCSPSQILSYIETQTKIGHISGSLFKDGQWQLDAFSLDKFATPSQELACASFFNVIGALAAQATDSVMKRLWVSHFHKQRLPGIRAVRQPDVALFDNHLDLESDVILRIATKPGPKEKPNFERLANSSQTFQTVRTTCQVKSNVSLISKARHELAGDAYFIFSSQDNRRYVLGISFCGTSFSLSLFDRAGALHSTTFDINGHPLKFIQLIAGLSLGADDVLGYDPTIEMQGQERFICVGDKRYQILNTEYISDMVRGRGTVCYRVSRDGAEYAIKDVWADRAREHTEIAMLQAAADANVQGVPTCMHTSVVCVNGREDSTSWPRQCIQPSHPHFTAIHHVEVREHRRHVITPFASPLISFTSKFELLSVLRDVINGKYFGAHSAFRMMMKRRQHTNT